MGKVCWIGHDEGSALDHDAPARAAVRLVAVDLESDDRPPGGGVKFGPRHRTNDDEVLVEHIVHRQYHGQRLHAQANPANPDPAEQLQTLVATEIPERRWEPKISHHTMMASGLPAA